MLPIAVQLTIVPIHATREYQHTAVGARVAYRDVLKSSYDNRDTLASALRSQTPVYTHRHCHSHYKKHHSKLCAADE